MNLVNPKQPYVRIASYNPYEAPYLGLKVISRDTLHLIKHLRASGITVIVEPDDERPVLYSTEKGFRELISDPVYAFLSSTPIRIKAGNCRLKATGECLPVCRRRFTTLRVPLRFR